MLSRALGLLFCIIGLLLPHRARIWFSEVLGWATQGVYYLYYGLMNYLLKELRESDAARKAAQTKSADAEASDAGGEPLLGSEEGSSA